MLKPCFEMIIQPELWTQENISASVMDFLVLSHERAIEFPEMLPHFSSAEVFNEDFLAVNELWALAGKLDLFQENIRGLLRLVGNRALETAEAFYLTLKIAARRDLPGTGVLFDELKALYPTKKRRRADLRAGKKRGKSGL
jgi:hypothetical protein